MLTLADCRMCHRLIHSFWDLTDDFSVNKPGIYMSGGYTLLSPISMIDSERLV